VLAVVVWRMSLPGITLCARYLKAVLHADPDLLIAIVCGRV